MPCQRVAVEVPGSRPYDVVIGQGLLSQLGLLASQVVPKASHFVVITDEAVAGLYLDTAKESLGALGRPVTDIVVPSGEDAKSLECACEIWRALGDMAIARDACIVALGGGVVGDLAGFMAATYMRGVSFIQVPTTLLSMVDSSVGGKTAVNLPAGKNLVGAFKQPALVLAATDTLMSLPEREWRCGLAEAAKSAVIDSDDFFFWISDSAPALVRRELDAVEELIARCVRFKASVVVRDECEVSGVRECLNYGHTFGHAVEAIAGYGHYSHGHAVAEGMRFAARLGVALAGTSLEFLRAQDQLLDSLGLCALTDFIPDTEDAIVAMRHDKKVRNGQVRFVLSPDVGEWQSTAVADEVLREHIEARNRSYRS